MKTTLLLSCALLVTFTACNEANTDLNTQEGKDSGHEYSLQSVDIPLLLLLPKEIDSVNSVWNANFGKAEIDGGEHFNLTIQEVDANIEAKKEELAMGIFQVEYIEEDSNHIVYKTALPDGSQQYYHFYTVKNVGGRTYVFENNQLMVFTLPDVRKMSQTALLARPTLN